MLFDASDEVMAGIADNLAFFSHHGVSALRAGIEKFFAFVGVAFAFDHLAKV